MPETTEWSANKTSRRECIRDATLGISALAMPSLLTAHGEAAAAEDRSEEALAQRMSTRFIDAHGLS